LRLLRFIQEVFAIKKRGMYGQERKLQLVSANAHAHPGSSAAINKCVFMARRKIRLPRRLVSP